MSSVDEYPKVPKLYTTITCAPAESYRSTSISIIMWSLHNFSYIETTGKSVPSAARLATIISAWVWTSKSSDIISSMIFWSLTEGTKKRLINQDISASESGKEKQVLQSRHLSALVYKKSCLLHILYAIQALWHWLS